MAFAALAEGGPDKRFQNAVTVPTHPVQNKLFSSHGNK